MEILIAFMILCTSLANIVYSILFILSKYRSHSFAKAMLILSILLFVLWIIFMVGR